MDTVLLVGAESIIGANLAASMASDHHVVALGTLRHVEISGCRGGQCDDRATSAVNQWIETISPDRIVVCGQDKSAWDAPECGQIEREAVAAAHWAQAAALRGCDLTVFSSDGIFTGPWMFHDEQSGSLCTSPAAVCIRNMEQRVLKLCPSALVVRTHVVGWSPFGTGWLDTMVRQLENESDVAVDCIRHASPLPAHLLASLLQQVWRESLQGLCHIAGSERISPHTLAGCLADLLDCNPPQFGPTTTLSSPPIGFGRGETSLIARRLRNEVQVAPPALKHHLKEMIAQRQDGGRERLLSTNLQDVA